MNGGVCLTWRKRKEEREREEGRWEYLIAGCIVIQEARNVPDKHISDLLSGWRPADRQQEAPRPAIQGYGWLSLWVT